VFLTSVQLFDLKLFAHIHDNLFLTLNDPDYRRPDASDPENMSRPNDSSNDFDPQEYTPEHSATIQSNSLSNPYDRAMTSVVAIGIGVAAAAFLVSNSELDHTCKSATANKAH
jgi:hypothetical protein